MRWQVLNREGNRCSLRRSLVAALSSRADVQARRPTKSEMLISTLPLYQPARSFQYIPGSNNQSPMEDSIIETDSSKRPAYQYASFGDSRSIRILTLHPASDRNQLLRGHLSTESLDESAPDIDFEAISYVWGSRSRTERLHFDDGRVLPITQSIHDALQRLRRQDKPRRLWADQVCINQNDVEERSQQVDLMNLVYRNARQILVWLGHDDAGVAQDAFNMIGELQGTFSDEQTHKIFHKAHSDNLHQQSAVLWKPLAKMALLPWFHRIWIVQEIGTATPATLFWGEAEISWDVLSEVVAVLNEKYHHLRSRFSVATPNIRYLYRRFVEPEDAVVDQYHRRGNFVYELHRARHMRAEDPRDRVYAFLGHFSLRKKSTTSALSGLVANYSRPVEDVYCDVAIRGLEGADSLIILSATHNGDMVSVSRQNSILTNSDGAAPSATGFSPDGLPSWVPDWRHRARHMFGSPDTPHRAAGATKPQLTIDKETLTLHVSGMHIDTIATASWVIHSHNFFIRGQRDDAIHPMIALWQRICGHSSPLHLASSSAAGKYYPTGESPFFVLAQCLTNASIGVDRSRGNLTISGPEHLANAAAYITRTTSPSDPLVSPEIRELGNNGGGDAFKWSHEASLISRYRRFAVSAQGHYILGPDTMVPGDAVVVLYGGHAPFVLRRKGPRTKDGWRLIGECYVHGMMNGEALDVKGAVEETFSIH